MLMVAHKTCGRRVVDEQAQVLVQLMIFKSNLKADDFSVQFQTSKGRYFFFVWGLLSSVAGCGPAITWLCTWM